MEPLRHGYTNRTLGDGATVVKRYQGPDARARAEREGVMLAALPGRVPVPPVLGFDDESLTMEFTGGTQGQELLEAGQGRGVLRACGVMLRQIHHAGRADALPGQAAQPGAADALRGRA
ncbi:MAG: phosphotransferase, partial [Actinobacteria bacterium]|nr:phosphotransferase [Actinomycetota bacterium]